MHKNIFVKFITSQKSQPKLTKRYIIFPMIWNEDHPCIYNLYMHVNVYIYMSETPINMAILQTFIKTKWCDTN